MRNVRTALPVGREFMEKTVSYVKWLEILVVSVREGHWQRHQGW